MRKTKERTFSVAGHNACMMNEMSGEKCRYVSFDGIMKLNTQYELKAGKAVTLDNGFTYAEIDIREFKKLSVIKITEFNALFPEAMINTPNAVNFNKFDYTNGLITTNGDMDMTMPNGSVGPDGNAARTMITPKNQKFMVLKMKLRPEAAGEGNISSYFPFVRTACTINQLKELTKCDLNKTIYFYSDKIHGISYITTDNKTKSCYYNGKYAGNFDGVIGFSSESNAPVRFAFDELAYASFATYPSQLKSEFLFWKNGKAVTLDGTELDWESMSDIEKQVAFKTGDLSNLNGAEKLLLHVYNATEIKCLVDAVPKNRIVIPKSFISIDKFNGIDKAMLTSTLSENSICKLLVSTDMKIYQTYDFEAQEWKTVNHIDLTAVKTFGVDASKFSDIDHVAWDKLIKGKSGVGFAYLIGIDDVTDQCAIDKLVLQVNEKGNWANV